MLSEQVAQETKRALGMIPKQVAMTQREEASLDKMFREMMQPLLKQWLDQHLPGIIDRLVREEIRRLTRDIDR